MGQFGAGRVNDTGVRYCPNCDRPVEPLFLEPSTSRTVLGAKCDHCSIEWYGDAATHLPTEPIGEEARAASFARAKARAGIE
jgi:hypothetical protein